MLSRPASETGEAEGYERLGFWKRIYRYLPNGILRNTGWTFSAQGLQLFGKFAYFAIAAKVLGPRGFGTFVACTALIATMAPFSALGTGEVMLKNTARDRKVLPIYLSTALGSMALCGTLLTLFAVVVLRPRIMPASVTAPMLAAVAGADLFGTQITCICQNAFAALGRYRQYTQLAVWATGARVFAALVLISTAATPLKWAYLYGISTVIAAMTGLVAVIRCAGITPLSPSLLFPTMREGFHYSISAASQSVYNDIDKTMLASLCTVETAAIYAIAYRFVDAAMVPVNSVAAASYPEFFRQGVEGVSSTFALAKRIIRRSLIYGLLAAVLLFLGAGLVPLIMGRGYAESVVALRWLCLLPAIKSVHAFLTDTLTGANYQWQRSTIQTLVAVFNVLINLWIIRAYAWRGAAWSSLATDLLLASLLYLVIRWHLLRDTPHAQALRQHSCR